MNEGAMNAGKPISTQRSPKTARPRLAHHTLRAFRQIRQASSSACKRLNLILTLF